MTVCTAGGKRNVHNSASQLNVNARGRCECYAGTSAEQCLYCQVGQVVLLGWKIDGSPIMGVNSVRNHVNPMVLPYAPSPLLIGNYCQSSGLAGEHFQVTGRFNLD